MPNSSTLLFWKLSSFVFEELFLPPCSLEGTVSQGTLHLWQGVNMRSKPSQPVNTEWKDTGIEDSWTESFQSQHL